jgi:hypothetical protein
MCDRTFHFVCFGAGQSRTIAFSNPVIDVLRKLPEPLLTFPQGSSPLVDQSNKGLFPFSQE